MITSVFLSSIYLIFPVLIYFIYMFYSKTICEKEKLVFLDLALFSSFYLCTKFGELKPITMFLINVPLLLALHKKRAISSTILVFITSIYLSKTCGINVYLYILCYSLIFILSFCTKFKTINIYALIKFLFDIIFFMVTIKYKIDFNVAYYFITRELSMYLLFYAMIFMYTKVENIVKLYRSLEEITKEKTMYESLFKITHEIKNPLAVCKGYLDMININNVAKANKYIGIIKQEVERTLVLLKDFSDVSKINIEKNYMDISLLLDDVYDETNLLFKRELKLVYEPCEGEVFINGDYDRLKQVLINVIKNAKEALDQNGKVLLESKTSKNNYIITVKDNGAGMDKDTLKNIGTPFYTTKKCGTGLGVYLSREIVEKHDGTMSYSSKIGKGTLVKITIPLADKKEH